MLAGISDPRDPRGIRHPLLAVLGTAVVATLAGAANFRELGSVAADLPQGLLALLGARWDQRDGRFGAPSGATLRRILIELDADALDRVSLAALMGPPFCHELGTASGRWAAGRVVDVGPLSGFRQSPVSRWRSVRVAMLGFWRCR